MNELDQCVLLSQIHWLGESSTNAYNIQTKPRQEMDIITCVFTGDAIRTNRSAQCFDKNVAYYAQTRWLLYVMLPALRKVCKNMEMMESE